MQLQSLDKQNFGKDLIEFFSNLNKDKLIFNNDQDFLELVKRRKSWINILNRIDFSSIDKYTRLIATIPASINNNRFGSRKLKYLLNKLYEPCDCNHHNKYILSYEVLSFTKTIFIKIIKGFHL